MPLPDRPAALTGLRRLLARRGESHASHQEPAVHPDSTLESMFAYQAERGLVADLPRQRRTADRTAS